MAGKRRRAAKWKKGNALKKDEEISAGEEVKTMENTERPTINEQEMKEHTKDDKESEKLRGEGKSEGDSLSSAKREREAEEKHELEQEDGENSVKNIDYNPSHNNKWNGEVKVKDNKVVIKLEDARSLVKGDNQNEDKSNSIQGEKETDEKEQNVKEQRETENEQLISVQGDKETKEKELAAQENAVASLKRKNELPAKENEGKKLKEPEGKVFVEFSCDGNNDVDIKSLAEKEKELPFEENDFMTQIDGKWVKRDALPKLEKFKSEIEKEANPSNKKKLEKGYKTVLAKAARKLRQHLNKEKSQDWQKITSHKPAGINFQELSNSRCGLRRLNKVKEKLVARGASRKAQERILKKIGRKERRKERLIQKKKAEKFEFRRRILYYRLNLM